MPYGYKNVELSLNAKTEWQYLEIFYRNHPKNFLELFFNFYPGGSQRLSLRLITLNNT